MLRIELDGPAYYDKVYGCWIGKNAGGTLGTPLEKAFGTPEPFDVWWYPELAEGGLPNDDLEIQLAWLKALEEIGPDLTARDLSRYWLDHVGYNFDEYGLSKTNLRLGLEPPVSGSYNNWFKDCMGCPIRSEIWACIAPGVPRLAVRYAFQDAICDHAGGESVFGELFNAAVESAAFLVQDAYTLVDIGLSYIPSDCRTATAIRTVLEAREERVDWKAARKRVLEATPHYNAQYSPINLGFQVIGLLYGHDFGDGLCKTVNCGYDTDSSGATVGSYLGIMAGANALPAQWIEPLGDTIATNESWGGVRHLTDGDNPIPADLDELVRRIRGVAHAVLKRDVVETRLEDLYSDDASRALWSTSPVRVEFPGPDLYVGIDYLDTPAVVPETTKTLVAHLRNRRPDPSTVRCGVLVPDGWSAPEPQTVDLPAYGEMSVSWALEIPAEVENGNRLYFTASPSGRPEPPAVPVLLVGATALRLSGPHPSRSDPPDEWRTLYAHDNALPIADSFDRPGVLHVQTFLEAPAAQEAWLNVDANCPVQVRLGGELLWETHRYLPVRPNYGGRSDSSGAVRLHRGFNELRLILTRNASAPPAECHVTLSGNDKLRSGQPQLGRTRFPDPLPPT